MTINVAFVVGKIGLYFPDKIAASFKHIIKRAGIGFCYAKSSIPELAECYKGYLIIAQRNSGQLLEGLSFFLESVGRYSGMPDQIRAQVAPILQELKNSGLPEVQKAYQLALTQMSDTARQRLLSML